MVVIVFLLGTLIDTEHVLQDQDMDIELLSQLLHEGNVMEPVDIDPGDRGRVFKREAFLDTVEDLLLQMLVVVIHQGDAYGIDFMIAAIDQRPGRQSPFVGTTLNQPGLIQFLRHPCPRLS